MSLGQAKTILLAMGSRALSARLRTHLERLGHKVEVCCRPAEVLARVGRRRPDLLMLDLDMPHRDGLDILIALRQKEVEADMEELPVMAIAAREEAQTRATAEVLGAVAYLSRRLDPRELAREVHKVLGGSAAGRASRTGRS